jgi:RNA polymerase sigma factor (TIGR02999 family)
LHLHAAGRYNRGHRNSVREFALMSDVTSILKSIEDGDPTAADDLLPLIYDELRKLAAQRMAQENPGQTLSATGLVHEVYLRLVDVDQAQHWDSRGHFFSAAAEAMRRILVESARAKKSLKRGGNRQRVMLQEFIDRDADSPDILLDLDEGLDRLAEEDAESAELVKLRLFAGLSVTEAGQALGLSRTVAYENWDFARSWFAVHLGTESG